MDEYIGTIKYFAFNYAPPEWLPCDGRTLSINGYMALYSLIGTTYGGDVRRGTFALPTITTKLGDPSGVGYCICVNGVYPQRP
jgi:microcystin-dependent protein